MWLSNLVSESVCDAVANYTVPREASAVAQPTVVMPLPRKVLGLFRGQLVPGTGLVHFLLSLCVDNISSG
jgi:hypothetical protein